MSDSEKFEGFKQQLIADNEQQYGEEIREKYGNNTVNTANEKVRAMSPELWQQAQDLSTSINALLVEAMSQYDPTSDVARKLCQTHREWLCLFWPEGTFSPEAHCGLADMYVQDARFKQYYDKIADGAAEFLRDAIHAYWQM